MTLDFAAAREAVTAKLHDLYADRHEQPRVLPYGWDTGTAWAPAIFWDGIQGVYVWLVDKKTGELTPKGFNEWDDMFDNGADPQQVGPWPAEESDATE